MTNAEWRMTKGQSPGGGAQNVEPTIRRSAPAHGIAPCALENPEQFQQDCSRAGRGRFLGLRREATAPRRLRSAPGERSPGDASARAQPIPKAVSRCRLPPQSKGRRWLRHFLFRARRAKQCTGKRMCRRIVGATLARLIPSAAAAISSRRRLRERERALLSKARARPSRRSFRCRRCARLSSARRAASVR